MGETRRRREGGRFAGLDPDYQVIDEAIGVNLRRLREERGETQDQIAHQVRWSRSTIAALENGLKAVDVGDLVHLCRCLDIPASTLLEGEGTLWLSPDVFSSFGEVRAVLGSASKSRRHLAKLDAPPVSEEVVREAEHKAAKRLSATGAQVLSAAKRQWGRSLTEERDARVRDRLGGTAATARTLQAMRGQVTRQLLEEIRPVLEAKPKASTRRGRNVK
jgi:transcriptional regulator with XRE-family HTH domain